MFNSLKEKLSNWIKNSKKKIEETITEPVEEQVEEKIKKKETEKKKKSKQKIKKLEKEIPQETPKTKEQAEEEIEKTQEKAVEIEEIIEGLEETKSSEETSEKSISRERYIEENRQVVLDKESFFSKLKSKFAYKITEEEFSKIFDDLEMLLLENNVAMEVVEDIRKKLSKELIGKEIQKHVLDYEIREGLKNSLNEILIEPDNPLDAVKLKKDAPFVILFFGINGTGKTTSIAKFAYLLKKNNISVVLAAADTFRAASIEQISEHAEKLKVPLIKQDYGSDPAAVGFDAIKYAKKNKINVVLIDTAGRMHTKTNLLNEMEKICRVTDPDLKIFVAESIAGNDAIEQAKTFNEIIGIDGSILSKADVDEKGGTIISVSHATHKPIFYLGTGQKYSDLDFFNKKKFIESLGL